MQAAADRNWNGFHTAVAASTPMPLTSRRKPRAANGHRRRTAVEKRRPIMEQYANWLNNDGTATVIVLDDHRARNRKA